MYNIYTISIQSLYRYNGLHLPMTTMDAASLHHSMGYTADPYLSGGSRRMIIMMKTIKKMMMMMIMMMIMTMIMPRSA